MPLIDITGFVTYINDSFSKLERLVSVGENKN
jgi:hypothetical protein